MTTACQFRCLVTAFTIFSPLGGLVVVDAAEEILAPVIEVEPQSITMAAGTAATFNVAVTGTEPITYQWYVGQAGDTAWPIAEATADDFTTPVMYANASYWVRATNDAGSVDSATATVTSTVGEGTGVLVLWGLGNRAFGAMGDDYGNHPALVPIQVGDDGIAVAAGRQQSLFLKGDGTLWKAGGNLAFEYDREVVVSQPAPVQIASDVVQAAIGGDFTLFITSDGTLWRHFVGLTLQVATDVRDCSAGVSHGLFITNDDALWAVGLNDNGQLGDGTTVARPEPVLVAHGVTSASAGSAYSLFVKGDNTLWAMGRNEAGQLGDGTTEERHTPVHIDSGVAVAGAGETHSAFIKTDGSLWAMGANGLGQLGDGTTTQRVTPVSVAFDVSAVAVGSVHTLFIDADSALWGMGGNFLGALGDGSTTSRKVPTGIAADVVSVSAGDHSSLFVKADGTIWANGDNFAGQLGDGETGFHLQPGRLMDGATRAVSAVDHSLLLAADGTLWATGDDSYVQTEAVSKTSNGAPVEMAHGVASVATNQFHTAFVKVDGTLWAFGRNGFGQLGDGTNLDRHDPVEIATSVSSVAAGLIHTAFVKTDGSLWTVGANHAGELGNGGFTGSNTPATIDSDVVSVAAGSELTMYVKSDGTAWGAGANNFGQLGDGTETNRSTPVQVGTGIASIAVGDFHTLFLSASGELTATGSNGQGQLGDGSTTDRNVPVHVAADVAAVAAGNGHTIFIKNDLSLWAVGANGHGQLGNKPTQEPFPFNTATTERIAEGVIAVAAGTNRTFFIQEIHPPVVSKHPANQAVKSNITIALSVQVSSEVPLEYQWFLGESGDTSQPLEEETTAFFTTPPLTEHTSYWVRITNLAGSVDSDTATITIVYPPAISTQPATQAAVGGSTIALAVEAESAVALDYQWYRGDSGDTSEPVAGATEATLTTPALTDDVAYWVRISNLAGTTDSAAAMITVVHPPAILTQPSTQTVDSGSTVELSVAVTDGRLMSYQWYLGESGDTSQPVAGATTAEFSLPAVTNHDSYWVRASNLAGMVDSATAVITVTGPIIAEQPVSVEGTAAGAVTLSVAGGASDGSEATYQWYFNGVAIEGATSAELTLPSVQSFHAGEYTVEITALGITVLSNSAALTVGAVEPSNARLLNLSTRALALRDSEVLIPGFVIQGSGTKKLLIRAVGPRLGEDPFFVPGVLPDPRMVLKRWNGSSYDDVANNDNWGDNANLDGIIQASAELYAFGLASGSLDAVLLVELAAGQYTVVADDANGDTGVALVELYDGDTDGDTARLINISSRGFVGTGANVMIPGVVISSPGPKTLLLRAVGPTLGSAPFNVPGVLADPVLTVYKGQNPILMNDDWSADPAMEAQTAAVAQQVSAFTLPSGSKDAAFVVTLQPGSYTVQASGKDGGTGVALVEVYAVP